MGNPFKSKLNQVADAVQTDAKAPPAPKADANQPNESCPMCGAMAKGLDADKLGKFMKNNPFKK